MTKNFFSHVTNEHYKLGYVGDSFLMMSRREFDELKVPAHFNKADFKRQIEEEMAKKPKKGPADKIDLIAK